MPVTVAVRVSKANGQLRCGHAPPTTSAATATATTATRLPSPSPADVGNADVVPGTVAAAQRSHVTVARKDATVTAHVSYPHAGSPTRYHAGRRPVQSVPSLLRQCPADVSIATTTPIATRAAVPDTPVGCSTREFPDAVA